MSSLTTRKTIVAHFNTEWGNTTPVVWSRAKFEKEGGPQDASEFVVFEIDYGSSETIIRGTTGTDTRHYGFVYITIYVPILSKENRIYELVDLVEPILERKNLANGVAFRNASRIENRDKSEYNSITVGVPFVVK